MSKPAHLKDVSTGRSMNGDHRYRRIGGFSSANKDIVFWGIAKATVPNYFLRRYLMDARPVDETNHLHLGCGTKYMLGFSILTCG